MKKSISVVLKGDIVLSKLKNYRESFLKVLDGDIEIVLNLNEVEKIDAAGVQFLMSFFNSRIAREKPVSIQYRGNAILEKLFGKIGIENIIYRER